MFYIRQYLEDLAWANFVDLLFLVDPIEACLESKGYVENPIG